MGLQLWFLQSTYDLHPSTLLLVSAILFSSTPPFKARNCLWRSMQHLLVRMPHGCLQMPIYPVASIYLSSLKSQLRAIRPRQLLGECAELTTHHAVRVREHLAPVTVSYLAPGTATEQLRDYHPWPGDVCLARLNGLMELRIQAWVKCLRHKLKHLVSELLPVFLTISILS